MNRFFSSNGKSTKGVSGQALSISDRNEYDRQYCYSASGEREQKRLVRFVPWVPPIVTHPIDTPSIAGGWVLGAHNEQLAVYHGQQDTGNVCNDTAAGVSMYPTEYLTYGNGDVANILTEPTGGKNYKIADHLGSTRVMVSAGGISGQSNYEPFGRKDAVTGGRKTYIDAEKDKETAMYNFGVRSFSEDEGRFISVDRLWEKYPHLSPYHYGANNPMIYRDRGGDSITPEEEKHDIESPVRELVDGCLGIVGGYLGFQASIAVAAGGGPLGITAGVAGASLSVTAAGLGLAKVTDAVTRMFRDHPTKPSDIPGSVTEAVAVGITKEIAPQYVPEATFYGGLSETLALSLSGGMPSRSSDMVGLVVSFNSTLISAGNMKYAKNNAVRQAQAMPSGSGVRSYRPTLGPPTAPLAPLLNIIPRSTSAH